MRPSAGGTYGLPEEARRGSAEADAQATAQHSSPAREGVPVGTILVKIGGSTLGSHDTTLGDLVKLHRGGSQVVVVHGGAKVINEWMEKLGVRPRFVRGLRVTDSLSMDVVVAVLTGLVNKSIVGSILAMGGRAVGLSGADGGMLLAEVLDPALGLVGNVVEVNTDPIHALVREGFIPVVAPVAINAGTPGDDAGPLLNVNADTVAGELAAALGVDRLVITTDVEGVLDTSRRLIPRLTRRQASGLMRSNVIAGGMVPKIGGCLKALDRVREAHIIDGRRPNALMDTLEGKLSGTRVG